MTTAAHPLSNAAARSWYRLDPCDFLRRSCDKEIVKIAQDEAKLRAKAIKACDPEKVASGDLIDAEGIGYAGEVVTCTAAVLKGLTGTAFVKHQQKIEKACGKPELGIDAIRDPTGLGMEVHDAGCAIALDSVGNIAQCLGQQHLCRTLQSAERGAPRLRELTQILGVLLEF